MELVTFDFFFMFECGERETKREKEGECLVYNSSNCLVWIVPRKRHPAQLWKVWRPYQY